MSNNVFNIVYGNAKNWQVYNYSTSNRLPKIILFMLMLDYLIYHFAKELVLLFQKFYNNNKAYASNTMVIHRDNLM